MDEQILQQPAPQPMPQPTPQPQYAVAAPKPEIKQFDRLFVFISVVLAFLFVRYSMFTFNGFFTTVSMIITFACCAVYVIKCGHRPTAYQWAMGAAICAFAFTYSVTSSPLLHVLCTLFLIAAVFWWVQAVVIRARSVTKFFPLDLMKTVCVQPFIDFGGAFRALSRKSDSDRPSAAKPIILGLIAALPLTVIVAALLADADAGIESILDNIAVSLYTNLRGPLIPQIILTFPAALIIFGMLRADAKQKLYPLPSDHYYYEKLSYLKKLNNLGVYAAVTPICLLYLMYVISQANYFLSAFSGKVPGNMLYSEYARRGFFELCVIAVINLCVILFMLTFSKKSGSGSTPALKAYTVIICAFTVFIISTALAKMLLYIGKYGLTRLRLYTSWFMVLLAVVFIVLAVRAFVKKLPTAKIITAAFAVMFGVLCFSKPDAFITEYNIHQYLEGEHESLDTQMLSTLSDDAYLAALKYAKSGMFEHSGLPQSTEYRDKIIRMCGDAVKSYDKDPYLTYNFSAQELKAIYTEYYGVQS